MGIVVYFKPKRLEEDILGSTKPIFGLSWSLAIRHFGALVNVGSRTSDGPGLVGRRAPNLSDLDPVISGGRDS